MNSLKISLGLALFTMGAATPALALASYLVAEWYANGNHFCRASIAERCCN